MAIPRRRGISAGVPRTRTGCESIRGLLIHPRRARIIHATMLFLAGSMLAGCAMLPPNSLFDPTKVGRFRSGLHETRIRTVLNPRETPPGVAHASQPTPADLAPVIEEYRLEPGDAIGVVIENLLSSIPYNAMHEVSSLGEIRIPELGTIRVEGMTEQEVEDELRARLVESRLLSNPMVVVSIQAKRARQFSIVGGVNAPGPYPITRPDMRLLEAISFARDASPFSRRAYVIRTATETSRTGAAPGGRPRAPEGELVIPPPPIDEELPATFAAATGRGRAEPPPPDEPGQAAGRAAQEEPATTAPAGVTRQELSEIMIQGETPPKPSEPTPPAGERLPSFIFDPQTGEAVQVVPERVHPPERRESDALADELDQPFDWESDVPVEFEQRVIEINLEALRAGDPRQNIVVRNRDVIHVPVDTGVFYMMGEVNRPGVYSLGGRELSVKQALAIAGGFSGLAWPQRCELIRKEPGTDRQYTMAVNLDAIMYGLEDDFYIRDGDILNVGTHIVAPFLFVVRNSFRFTYGFGFVYDRNFADKDSYGVRPNPYAIEAAQQAQRGLPF